MQITKLVETPTKAIIATGVEAQVLLFQGIMQF